MIYSNDEIVVSVCISAYNHREFIEETLNSILEQECNFNYEVVLSNDFSTDNTHSVISQYLEQHPNAYRIRYYNQQTNLGINANLIFTLENAAGKYIALLEGDDYWLDKHKLQKQFDFMEDNKDYTLCTAAYRTITVDNKLVDRKLHENIEGKTYEFSTTKSFMPNYLNMFFRRQVLDIEKLKTFSYSGDNVIFLMCLSKGKAYFHNEIFGFRRIHSQSAWTAKSETEKKRMGIEQLKGLYRFPEFRTIVRADLFYNYLDLAGLDKQKFIYLFKAMPLINSTKEFVYFSKVVCKILI